MSSKFSQACLQWLMTRPTRCHAIRRSIKAVNDRAGQKRSYGFGLKNPSASSSSNNPTFPDKPKSSSLRERELAPWTINKQRPADSAKTDIVDNSGSKLNVVSQDKPPPAWIADMRRTSAKRGKRPREPLPPIVVPKLKKIYVTPNIIIFHNTESAASVKALKVLEDAQIAFPNTKRNVGPPLPLNVIVERRLPTVEEIQDACVLKEELTWTDFLSEQASTKWQLHPTNARTVIESVELQQKAFIERPDKIPEPIGFKERDLKSKDEDGESDSSANVSVEKLNTDDPLFGTATVFAWPMIIWDNKETLVGPGLKRLRRLLIKTKHVRDGSMDPKEHSDAVKRIKQEMKEARWAKTDRKEVIVPEDQALQWFRETGD